MIKIHKNIVLPEYNVQYNILNIYEQKLQQVDWLSSRAVK